MQSSKKVFGLGLVLAALVSTLPVSETRAITMDNAKYYSIAGSCVAGIWLLNNFWMRKPAKEPRFDVEKLKHGSVKEKAKHAWYFFYDKLIGWPYKSKKVNCIEEDGKTKLEIENEQLPGGVLGNFQGHVLVGANGTVWWVLKSAVTLGVIALVIDTAAKGKLPEFITNLLNKKVEDLTGVEQYYPVKIDAA